MPGTYARLGEDFIANTTRFADQARPTVAKLKSGHFVVAWDDNSQQGGDNDLGSVRVQIFDRNGAAVGSELLVNTATVRGQSDSKVVSLQAGGFLVTWTDYSGQGGDDQSSAVKAQMFDAAGGRVGGEMLVNTTVAGYQMYQNASGLADGGFVIVWADVQGLLSNQGNIRGQRFDVAGNKLGSEFEVNSMALVRQSAPKVATLEDGRFIVTWTDATTSTTGSLDGSGSGVRGQIFAADGSKIGGEFQVNQHGSGNQFNQSVTALPGGGFLAIWQDQQGFPGSDLAAAGGSAVEAQIFDATGNRVGNEFVVNDLRRTTQSGTTVAVNVDGTFVVSWNDWSYRDSDEVWNHISAQVFGPQGQRVGTQFYIESHQSVHDQTALAALDDGRFVAVWHGGEGSAFHNNSPGEVRVQIYKPSAGITDIVQTHGALGETTPDNVVAAILSASIDAVNERPTYQIIADSTGGAFRLEGDRLVVANNSKLDHETNPDVQVTVRAYDGTGGHFDEILQFHIVDAGLERRFSASDERLVNTNAAGNQVDPALAALSGGGYAAVWTDYSPFGDNLYGRAVRAQLFNADGSRKGAEFVVNLNRMDGEQSDATATALSNGNFLVSWADQQPGGSGPWTVQAALFTVNGARVGDQFQLSGSGAGDRGAPALTALGNGGFVAVWTAAGEAGDGSGTAIRLRIFDAAGQGGAEILVNTIVAGDQFEPSIGRLADGGFVVTWSDLSGADPVFRTGVRGQRFDASGNKVGGEFLVNGGPPELAPLGGPEGDHTDSAVVGLAGGGWVVVWNHVRDMGLTATRMQVFDANGRETHREFLVQDRASDGRVAALPDGSFMIVYTDHSSDTADTFGVGIRAQFFTSSGVRVGDSFLVNENLPDTQVDPAIATLASGGLALAWIDRNVAGGDGNGTAIKTRTLSPKAQTEEELVSPGSTRGTAGNDVFMLQEPGDVKVYGLAGVDSFYFGGEFTAADYVDGGSNRDAILLQGWYGGTVFGANGVSNITGIESISLMSGTVTTWGQVGYASWYYNLTMLDGNVAAGAIMKVNGFHLQWDEHFTFDGSADSNGSFSIFAGMGRDQIKGGGQNDSIIFGQDGRFKAGDTVSGGGGYDVVYLRGDYAIDFNAAGFAGSLVGVESIGLLSATSNEFVGGGDGEFDYDIIWSDGLLIQGGTFTINGSRLTAAESFLFDGSSETNGALRIFGGAAADRLTGGAGDDQITGGGGIDSLRGGAGADRFRYSAQTDSTSAAFDTIQDFVVGTDKIDVQRIDAKASTPDNEAFAYIGGAAFSASGANAPGELRSFNVAGNLWQVEADVNGDGIADLVIQLHIENGQPLTSTDFLV